MLQKICTEFDEMSPRLVCQLYENVKIGLRMCTSGLDDNNLLSLVILHVTCNELATLKMRSCTKIIFPKMSVLAFCLVRAVTLITLASHEGPAGVRGELFKCCSGVEFLFGVGDESFVYYMTSIYSMYRSSVGTESPYG